MEALRLFEETIKSENICYNLTGIQDFCQESYQNHFTQTLMLKELL